MILGIACARCLSKVRECRVTARKPFKATLHALVGQPNVSFSQHRLSNEGVLSWVLNAQHGAQTRLLVLAVCFATIVIGEQVVKLVTLRLEP